MDKNIYQKARKRYLAVKILLILLLVIAGVFFIYRHSTFRVFKSISDYMKLRESTNSYGFFEYCGMDYIWPESINEHMSVNDLIMVYYNPFDVNRVGYIDITIEDEEFLAEKDRLANYSSTEYDGVYGASGFRDYEVLAINASDEGFVYAISKENNRIIYVCLTFPGYSCDLDYQKYIPSVFIPEGIDISKTNPRLMGIIEQNEESLELYNKKVRDENDI